MIDIEPKDLTTQQVFGYLLGGIAPRPIALVSTVAADGTVNLSPFSFFNTFGANPPIVAFSPSRRVRDNTTKDTYGNLLATRECVIQAVTYAMVQQVSLASTEYGSEIDEFVKSGLTKVPSDIVKPPRVQESPFQMECRLQQMITLGDGGGAGNLAICEVVKFHIAEDIIENGVIQPERIDLVARMGADFYTRASGEAVFEVRKPLVTKGIGYDQLPEFIRRSDVLTANNLAQLANTEHTPSADDIREFRDSLEPVAGDRQAYERAARLDEYDTMMSLALTLAEDGAADASALMLRAAATALDDDNVEFAWKAALLSRDYVR
ncbi:MAG: flavin reductase family protein [candidate division Zixibacteria bacterium]|nr:flavin reductase family protein [candidate division Zixibacteria bacterium]